MKKKLENNIIIFKTNDEKISVDVRFGEENVFDEGELTESATVANFATVGKEGERFSCCKFYNNWNSMFVWFVVNKYVFSTYKKFLLVQTKKREGIPNVKN